MSEKKQISRRAFLKKAAYVAPVVLSLPVIPTVAAAGSGKNYPGGGYQGSWPSKRRY